MRLSTSTFQSNGWPTPSTALPMPDSNPSKAPVEDIDSLCVRSIAEGDREVFSSLVERWQNRLINFFYRSTSNRAEAEDLAQETFIELYRVADRYEARGSFRSFLFTIARRRLIDSYRKRARRPLDYIDPIEYTMQQQAEPDDTSREIKEAFHRALAALPENQRNAILLRQQQELSYEEIAETLDASISAVKTWIHRARTQLRNELKDFYQAG